MSLPHCVAAPAVADGFVLAGGQSSRMGRDKSLVSFNGAPLIQHAVQILRASGLELRIAGARSDLSSFAPALADNPTHAGRGPLSGICTALDAGTARFALFLPVDLPLLPARLLNYLLHHAEVTESAITMASICGFVETFPVVIDRAAAPHLRASLESDDRKCLTAFRTAAEALSRPMSVVAVELLVQSGQVQHGLDLPPQAWFRSVNTAADLAYAESLTAIRNP